MRVETINFIRKNAASLDLSEPILVIRKGAPAYVIESYEHYQERENALALLKLLTLSEGEQAGDQTVQTRRKYQDIIA
ncbi:prevent-host-death protein [Trabulsiella odontotermitis]|uniref:prevent-host-death protein n=1 Tax=Trabulsiella odontotermitis TaxID=379893 RepID=UPI0006BA3CE3|nr:prevent-host-death protein [Trabulsiella odontotermitis]